MSAANPPPSAEHERLRDLATLAARRAARALADFTKSVVRAGPLRESVAGKLPTCDSGVFFAMDGWVTGRLALLFDPLSRRSLIRMLLDEEESEAPPEMVASALCELANILASQAVSAIADARGSLVSVSVPHFEPELASTRFASACGGALVLSCEIAASDLELRIVLALAPSA
jgi:CheY-specific phosphatase CheX